MNTCAVPGCPRPPFARTWCRNHHRRSITFGTPTPDHLPALLPETSLVKCAVDGCDVFATNREWCRSHYRRWCEAEAPPSAIDLTELGPITRTPVNEDAARSAVGW